MKTGFDIKNTKCCHPELDSGSKGISAVSKPPGFRIPPDAVCLGRKVRNNKDKKILNQVQNDKVNFMKNILRLNLILIAIYLVSLSLAKWLSFPYLVYPLGLVIFFLPGLYLALALEQMTSRLGRAKLALWTFLFSLIATPALELYFPMFASKVAQEKDVLLSFFIWTFLALAIFLSAYLFRKKEITMMKIPSFRKYPSFWIAIALFISTLAVHFMIYPFIPEADGYGYLQATEKTIETGVYSNFDSRKIFLALSWTLFHLTGIPLFLIYKIFLPLLGIFTWLVFYEIARKLFQEKWKIVLMSLSPLFFPIFSLDSLIPRPQLIFTLVFPVYLYLLQELKKIPFWKAWFAHLVLFLLAISGMQFHQIFMFLPVIHILFLGASIDSLKLNSIKAYFFYAVLAISLYASTKIPTVSMRLDNAFQLVFDNFSVSKFRLWFLDDYTDVYGEKMGWPGFSFLYYYGYNLGLIFPILLILAVIGKAKIAIKENQAYFLAFLAFFFFAEVAPRFGLAYAPSRMWLFVSLALAFFVPVIFKQLEHRMPAKKLFAISACLVFGSMLLNFSLTYEKQGWISMSEYRASQFIKDHTEKNAIFLTQTGCYLATNHFGKRSSTTPSDEFFLKNIPEKDRLVLDNLTTILNNRPKVNGKIVYNIPTLMRFVYSGSEYAPDLEEPRPQPPIYIFYSTDKFQGIKGNRAWWKKMNFFGADLGKFDDASRYEKVYDEGGVFIWKVIQ
jgi:hypothetical protein